jgi:lipopolysaccharide export LptBFGC system permease protein LptF
MTRLYRLSLHLLPADLRDAHGSAMEQMFVRELAQARSHGWLSAALTGAAGLWDVVKRAAYERGRSARNPSGPQPTSAQLLRRLAASFAIAFVGLTASLLFLFGSRQIPSLNARGASAETIAQFLLLSVPFTAAMTIPMAVFLSVLHEFTRLGAKGILATAWRDVRRLLVTVLAAAVGVAALACVVTAEMVPRANERLSGVLSGGAVLHNDRTMTISELREAARTVKSGAEPIALARAASYEVEIQKKFALPAACLVLALVGMAIAFTFPRGGMWLVFGASLVVFGAYYTMLMAGESLADQLVVSPVVGMWGANALLLTAALLAVWRRSGLRKEALD